MSETSWGKLKEIAQVFLKIGIIGFGGPAAHIAMMETEIVKRRQWLTQEHFLDLLGATNLIPGPNSTEMAIHVGYVYGGWLGLLIAGFCFITPAVISTGSLAAIYVAYGQLPQIAPLFYGIKPAVLMIIGLALWRLRKKAIKNRQLMVVAIAVIGLLFFGFNEIIALLVGGLGGMLWLKLGNSNKPPSAQSVNLLLGSLTTGITLKAILANASPIVTASQVSLWQLGFFFLKVSSILYGSGYVLIAFLQGELVEQYGWLTQQQLLDAIAIGQFTPGPVFSTATFIGYVIAGVPGAIVSTVGIFLPSFIFVLILNPLIPKLRASSWTAAFLDAINASSLALMAVATAFLMISTFQLSRPPLIDLWAVIIAIAAAIALRYQVNSAWIVLGGAILGWIGKFGLSL